MVTNVLDQAGIADAINRQKLGSQRTKNEMMRQGTQDPGAFAMNNQSQIQQAQQPSEFWGAGRKEMTAGTDQALLGALGGTKTKLGGQDFYYSDYDLGKASWGTQDKDDIDLGKGQYNIMQNGQSLGTGYKSLADTIRDYRKSNLSTSTSTVYEDADLPGEAWTATRKNNLGVSADWLSSNGYRLNPDYNPEQGGSQYQKGVTKYQVNDPKWADVSAAPKRSILNNWSATPTQNLYNTQAEADQVLQQHLGMGITGNSTRDWETLGQLLNYGSITGDFSTPYSIGGNNASDPVKGLNTLFGSKPIIYDGKLLGYNNAMGVDPITNSWNDQYSTKSSKSWDVGNVGMGRQSVDPTWLSKNAVSGGDGRYTITPEKAALNPGWNNQDYFNRNVGSVSQKSKTGFLGGVFNILDPILDTIDPMHNKVQEWTTGSAERDQQAPYFQKIAPMIINGFFPGVGSALSAVDSASLGDTKGAVGNAAASYFGMSGGIDTGYGNLANTAANGAAGNAINSFASGGDLADMFKAAATGALGGAAGGAVGSATSGLNPALSGFLSGAAKGAVSSLAQPKAMFESALSSGTAGGLSGMFTPTNATPEQKRQVSGNASSAVKLAKLFTKKK